jgi:tRNA A37 threonylcarbamoyladenosine dehydratase
MKGAAAVAGSGAVSLEADEADALVCAVGDVDGSLNCHGYGSSVAVTASFGMAAAAELVKIHLKDLPKRLALNLKVALE